MTPSCDSIQSTATVCATEAAQCSAVNAGSPLGSGGTICKEHENENKKQMSGGQITMQTYVVMNSL